MTSEHQQWQELKQNYLKYVEQALASVDSPNTTEILNDVAAHLENKYADLPSEHRTWEAFQQIITEMGPPQEYAELLCEDTPATKKPAFGINEFLAVVFVVVLMVIGVYMIYTAKNTPPVDVAEKQPIVFSADLPVDGIAISESRCTADFVQSLLGAPKRIDQNGRMLRYTDNGIDFWFSENGPLSELHLNQGFKGRLDTGISLSSSQEHVFKAYGKPIKKIDTADLHRKNDERILYQKGDASRIYYGGRGLIFWFKNNAIMQIVVFKGNLIQLTNAAKTSVFELDEQVLGKWTSVDFVKTIDNFNPARKSTQLDLFLTGLSFEPSETVIFSFMTGQKAPNRWSRGEIYYNDDRPSHYEVRTINGENYLFMEWISGDVTIRGQDPWYYALKQVKDGETIIPDWFENDPHVLGTWITVDFVETLDVFRPKQKSWQGKLFVKRLDFKQEGIVEWCLGEDQMKINHRWTKGKLLDKELPARYIIERYDDGDYLFIEWNSGDVTIRGQKPCYYVLKKSE